jgi:hypothetical protein
MQVFRLFYAEKFVYSKKMYYLCTRLGLTPLNTYK